MLPEVEFYLQPRTQTMPADRQSDYKILQDAKEQLSKMMYSKFRLEEYDYLIQSIPNGNDR